ncbi:nitroreductase [Desmospora activa]|uniref:Nitroreductase n=1 Tax=Desmospora activa DSM 45169 TaxID=1121389 RepID=A0A2T4ZCI4_9BACL|nr:nitroreductase [Desmospora activa]PTM59591.1 nitroreductase [Desmospora activa DSM 45169]
MPTKSFQEVIRSRQSVRQFLSTPVKEEVIRDVLKDAQCTPSNCNTQPWNVHIVSGVKKEELSKALMRANEEGNHTPDFTFDMNAFYGRYAERKNEHGKTIYEAQGIARKDYEGRQQVAAQNYNFFNAPHAAFLFMPSFGDNVRVASDIGMYGQSFLLALEARGIGGIPQTALGFFADTVRDVLGVSDDLKLLFGISFGYPDKQAAINGFRMGRDPIEKSVTFHC